MYAEYLMFFNLQNGMYNVALQVEDMLSSLPVVFVA